MLRSHTSTLKTCYKTTLPPNAPFFPTAVQLKISRPAPATVAYSNKVHPTQHWPYHSTAQKGCTLNPANTIQASKHSTSKQAQYNQANTVQAKTAQANTVQASIHATLAYKHTYPIKDG